MSKQKRKGVHVVPKPPEPPAPKGPAVNVTEEWMRKIAPILDGKAPAPNEFVGYLAEQVTAANDERNTLMANLRQLSNQVNQMRERVTALDGQINARLNDMRAWWDRKPTGKADDGKPFLLKPESEAKDAGADRHPDPKN